MCTLYDFHSIKSSSKPLIQRIRGFLNDMRYINSRHLITDEGLE